MRFPLGPWCALLLLGACSSTVPITLDVHTDLVAFEEFDTIRIQVGDTVRETPVRPGERFLPTPRRYDGFGVRPGSTVAIEVALLAGSRTALRRRVSVRVVDHSVVPVWLLRSCLTVTCPDGSDALATECDDGRCVRPECRGDECGMPSCTRDDECSPPSVDCAVARCAEGRCTVQALDAACAMDEYCSPVSGCLPRTEPIPPDAGSPDAGTLPECASDRDCPRPIAGPWSGCTYAGVCAESAPAQERVVTTYRCTAGRCAPSDGVETAACARSTAGLECAPAEVGDWGPCAYGSVCPIVGTRERPVTRYACAAGACSAASSVETDTACPPPAEVCDLVDNDCDARCDPGCRLPIRRGYRDATTSHLYSQSLDEAMCCGFVLEDADAFWVYGSNVGGLVALNRCYAPSSNVHVVGTGGACEGVPGAIFEFAIGYVSPTPVCGARPLYRLTLGDRSFLTIDAAEASFATSIGWTDRGVIGYAWPD